MSSTVDRSRPPSGAPARRGAFPPFTRERLESGLEVLVCAGSAVPTVHLMLLLDAGGAWNPIDRPGLATLTGALVDEGTRNRSGPEIAAELEQLGAVLSVRTDWDVCQLEIHALAGDLETALRVLAELAAEASFPEAELERLRQQTLTEIRRRRDRPALLADLALLRELYAGTPYGDLGSGSEAALRAVARDEIVAFYESHFAAPRRSLILTGDLDVPRARELAAAALPAAGAELPPAPEVVPPRRPRPRVRIVDLPHAAQTELRIGHVGIARRHPDRARFGLLNALLGGKFTSRLNLNLRERHGYTYGVTSRLADRRSAGPFVVSAAVANESVGAAARETVDELRRLREERVTESELAESRDYLIGVFPFTLQRAAGIAARLADLAAFDLPSDHFDSTLREIAATSAEDLLEVARRHLRPDDLALTAAGPAAQIAPQLQGLGELEVVDPDGLDRA